MPASEVTQILHRLADGDELATEELFGLVYEELRALAGSFFRGQRADHTLQPTALVHEAYIKLVDQNTVNWNNRAHFYSIAAKAMRRHWRKRPRASASCTRRGFSRSPGPQWRWTVATMNSNQLHLNPVTNGVRSNCQ